MHPDYLILFALILLCLGSGFAASLATRQGVRTWYPTLRKPGGTPPNWLFAPVWTALYILMAVAAWLVWREVGWHLARPALVLFFGQLALNIAWSGIFFASRQPGLALAEIVILWLAIASTAYSFWFLMPLAGVLLLPYLAWVSYATYLNLGILRLNSR